jgi:hypothetical protein
MGQVIPLACSKIFPEDPGFPNQKLMESGIKRAGVTPDVQDTRNKWNFVQSSSTRVPWKSISGSAVRTSQQAT